MMLTTPYFFAKVNKTRSMSTTPHPRLTVGLLITQGHWGGAQQYVFDLATHLASEMNVVVGIGSPTRGQELQQRLAAWNTAHPKSPITIQQLTHLVREISPLKDLRALAEIKNFVVRNHLDILHCNSAKATVIGSFATRALPVRRVTTVHGFTFTEPLSWARRAFYRTLERIASTSAHLLICPDRASYAIAKDSFHIPQSRLALIPHTRTDIAFLPRDAARTALAKHIGHTITDHTQIIGSIANFYKVKNQALLLESFALLAQQNPEAICILIGDGSERQNLESIRTSLPCANRIFFAGAIENAATLLRGFEVFALTSDKEGYPFVLLEARAAGIPIVVRNIGGCPEIIEGVSNASSVTTPTPTAIAAALTRALEQNPISQTRTSSELMHNATRVRYHSLVTNQ